MKKSVHRSILAVLLIAAMLFGVFLLPGCNSSDMGETSGTNPPPGPTPTGEPTEPPETSLATEPSEEVTEPSTEATEPEPEFYTPTVYPDITTYGYTLEPPVLPFPAEDAPEEEWMDFFYGLLSKSNSWYCIGLNSFYETTADMDIGLLFAVGIEFGGSKLTEEELNLLGASEIPYHRMARSDLNSILRIYFDTSLDECSKLKDWSATYLEQTDCYYTRGSGAPIYAGVYGIIGYEKLENGDYAVQYMSDMVTYPYGPAEVVLHRVGDYFQIVSNRMLEVE